MPTMSTIQSSSIEVVDGLFISWPLDFNLQDVTVVLYASFTCNPIAGQDILKNESPVKDNFGKGVSFATFHIGL